MTHYEIDSALLCQALRRAKEKKQQPPKRKGRFSREQVWVFVFGSGVSYFLYRLIQWAFSGFAVFGAR